MSISTSGPEKSTSQEYRSSSNTAIASSESILPKRQSSGSKKNLELTLGHKLVQAVSEYINQNVTEITPAYDQLGSTKKAKATQGRMSKLRKTGTPKDPSQSTSMTEASEGPKPSKSRSILSLKERIRRAKAVRAQSWKLKAQRNSQKLTKTSSKTYHDSDESLSTNEPPGQTPGSSKADDTSSCSESTSTDLSNSESFQELTNLLTQEVQRFPENRDSPGHYTTPSKGQ